MKPKCIHCRDLGIAVDQEGKDGPWRIGACTACSLTYDDDDCAITARNLLWKVAGVARARAIDEVVILGRRILLKDVGAL